MEVIPCTQFDGMCRTCMSCQNDSSDNFQLQSLFDYIDGFKDTKTHIFEIFNSTIQILPKIEMTDQLPKTVCRTCLDKLTACYEFQQGCLSADNHYRKLLATSGVEDIYAVDVICETIADPLQDETISNPDILEVDEFVNQEMKEPEYQLKLTPSEKALVIEDLLSNESELSEVENTKEPEKNEEDTSMHNDCNAANQQIPNSTKDMSLTCEKCKKTYVNKKSLLKHFNRLHKTENLIIIEPKESEQTYKCKDCGVGFTKKLFLERHKNDHKQSDDVKTDKKCEYCGLTCKTVQSLKKHCQLSHKDQLEPSIVGPTKLHICQYCNKSFKQSCTLKDHIRIHTKIQPFLCSHCGKAFNSNSNLQQHLLRHSGERRYECPDCPKKFPCLSDLSSHKQVHKKLRPHICDLCGSAFGKPVQLKKHKMYHSGEKPYQCEYCEMRFVCADHMRRHMRTHTGEKPYKCKYCTRTFTQSNDMMKHLRLHLGENVYLCELCPSSFRLATELREHFAVHKNDDPETRERNLQALLEAQEKLRMKLELDRAIGVSENRK